MKVSDKAQANPQLVPLVQVDHNGSGCNEDPSFEVPQGQNNHENSEENFKEGDSEPDFK